MVEIAIAVSKRFRTAVVDNFRSFALKNVTIASVYGQSVKRNGNPAVIV